MLCLANSTIRIAFLLARPTSTTKPIWVNRLTSMPAMFTPTSEQSRHIGTTRITASGSFQLSYCAASTRKTKITASAKTPMAVLPAWSCMKASSVQSEAIDRGSSAVGDLLHHRDRLARAGARRRVAGDGRR